MLSVKVRAEATPGEACRVSFAGTQAFRKQEEGKGFCKLQGRLPLRPASPSRKDSNILSHRKELSRRITVKINAAMTGTALSGGYCVPSYANLQHLQIVSLLAREGN